jgi:uncharacterized protein (DUF2267 family)
MQYAELLKQVERGAPTAERAQAERAVTATLRALCHCLTPQSVHELGRLFPAQLGQLLEGNREQLSLEAFYALAAAFEGAAPGQAREHVQVVCTALGTNLDPDLRMRLERELPEEIGQLLMGQPSAPAFRPHLGHAATLAEGRPGSVHPVSTEVTGSRHPVHTAMPDTSQQGSVAEPNPHADTKLSSSPGLTQQREKESLSDGRSKLP